MKVCLINNLYKPYQRGGAEQIVLRTYQSLLLAKHEAFIITTCPKYPKAGPQTFYLKSQYYNLDKMPTLIRFLWHLKNIFNFKKRKKIKKILLKEKPDLVISHNLIGLGFLIPNLIKKLGIKHIHVLHDVQLLHPSGLMLWKKEKKIDSFFANIYQNITKKQFSKIETIISPSKWLLDKYKERGFFKNSQTKIIPNPLEIKTIDKSNKEKKDPFTLLFLGQMESHKGLDFLLKTFQKLPKDKYFLHLIGDGSLLKSLKDKYTNSNIKFHGYIEKKIDNFMKKSHALILPSLCYENSPTVIFKALQNNTPTIASRLGGITEIIHAYGGLLFTPLDSQDLIKKIEYLKNNYEKIKLKTDRLSVFNGNNYIEKLLS